MCEVFDLDGRIGALATVQGGVVSREQVIALGAGPRAIEVRMRRGRLVKLHRGVYAVGHLALMARGKAIGALLAAPGAVLSHRTAGAVWVIRDEPVLVAATLARLIAARDRSTAAMRVSYPASAPGP